ncbi:MAG TPA: VCBS repeat-containing protein [Chthoniobacterales bacterium]
MKVSGKTLPFIIILGGLCVPVCGAAVYQSNGTAASVQALHTIAQNGDTITLPPGTFTWSTHVSFSKAVNVQGAGTAQTVIYDNVPKTGGSQSVLWSFNVASGQSIRVTGFTVRGQTQDTQNHNQGTLAFFGGSHKIRIDHVNIIRPGTGAMIFGGDLWGVIDHCYFDDSNFKQAIQVHHGNWNGDAEGWGDGSYEDSLHLGTERAIYIEDCTFLGSGTAGAGVVDGSFGGRFVFRHNTVTNDTLAMHGTEGFRGRGLRSYEIYDNRFVSSSGILVYALYLRSGTGVIFDNSFFGGGGVRGYRYGLLLTVYRATTGTGQSCSNNNFGAPWNMATGSNPWDGNSGARGYPAIDQVGRGTCADAIRGDPPVNQTTGTQSWPHNASEPVYEWGDTIQPIPNNPGALVAVQCSPDLIQAGRDFHVGTPMPGYTPYPYPHPLVIGAPRAVVTDFNGDGYPDFVLQRDGAGETAIWYLGNNILNGGDFGPTLPISWKVTGAADFNRDGHTDYAVFQPATGHTAIGYMSGPALIGADWGPTLPPGWELVGAADFNGDGYPDFVVYHAGTHQTAIAYLRNNVLIGADFGPAIPNGWNLIGVADFDRDGHPDYALFNATTGETAIWYLSGPTFVRGAFGPTISSGWVLVATADFDRDGSPDYLVYNLGTHETAIWYLNNNVFLSSAPGPTIPAAWSWEAP